MKEERHKYDKLLRALIYNLSEPIFVFDFNGTYLFVNEAFARPFGKKPEEIIGKTPYDIFSKKEAEKQLAIFRSVINTEKKKEIEVKIKTAAGKTLYYKTIASSSRNRNGSIVLVVCFSTDITESRQAKVLLKKSEKRYRVMFENTGTSMILVEEDMTISMTNERFLFESGYLREEVIGRKWTHFVDPKDLEEMVEKHKKRRENHEDIVPEYEFSYYTKAGERHEALINVQLVPGTNKSIASLIDITGRKLAEKENRKLEERLKKAEIMEILGRTVGKVAHELNNVAGVTLGYAELLKELMPVDSTLAGYADKIKQSSIKTAAIVEDLLVLARRGVRVMGVIRLNKIIIELLANQKFAELITCHPKVVVTTDLEGGLQNICGSEIHLESLIFNLIKNAAEAIIGEGEISIKTENCFVNEVIVSRETIPKGEYVVLTISDTGEGVSVPELEKIFEPFYSKKFMGRSGTGLGLAIVLGVVQDHRGYVDVKSVKGKGTIFTIYFPVTRERVVVEVLKSLAQEYQGHGESILVIDDVEDQRQVAATILTQLGYSVNVVSGGEEAVEYLKSNRADILVLDMIMDPGIDGCETYRRVIEIIPGQKAIIVSGFSETDRSREAQKLGAGAYIKKPYLKEKLGLAIKEELGR